MADEEKTKTRVEIAHVLFMDIVGYSKLLDDEQTEAIHELNAVVRGTEAVEEAEAAGALIRLPTGDGMALVFTSSVEAPVECALQIAQALRAQPSLPLRMGIHSGPVQHVEDISGRVNVAGAGINLAQRVMDCGDMGHILVSKRVADDLAGSRRWQPFLHALGDCEVKHGVVVSLVNLYADVVGNPAPPARFGGGKAHRQGAEPAGVTRPVVRQWLWGAAALALVAGVGLVVKYQNEQERTRTEARAALAEREIAALHSQLQQQTRLISLVSEKLDHNTSPGGGDSAATAREETSRQLGISVEDLQKQLANEKTDVGALVSRIEQGGDAAEAKAAEWKKLRRDALTKLGDAEDAAGHYAETIEPYQKALALTDKNAEPLVWCDAARNLETALWEMGRYYEAEPLARGVAELRAKLDGPEQPDTLTDLNRLANLLSDKGDNAAAEPIYRRVLEARERTLGKDDPATLSSVNNLAALLVDKGDLTGAEPLYRRALEAHERVLGKDHPDTLDVVSNLAVLLADKGDNVAAEALYRRALEGRERQLGKDHPDTLTSVNNLAVLLSLKGDYAAVEPLYRRVLEARERTLGKEHPDTLVSMVNLANLLTDKGDHAAAESLCRQALEIRERTLGPEHPDTLSNFVSLADLLRDKGDYLAAEPLYRRALEAQERTLGKENPQTLRTVSHLAQWFDKTGEDAAAESFYLRAQAGMARVVSPGNLRWMQLENHFSLFRQKQGRLEEALPLEENAVTNARAALPETNPDRLEFEKNLRDLRARLSNMPHPPPGTMTTAR